MAEAAVLGVAKSLLQQLASPTSNEFLLVWNFDKDLNSLQQTIQTITNFLLDAEQRESKEHLVKGWLSRLRAVLYEADDLFDAVAARALRKKVMSGNTFRKEVCLFFSKSNQLGFVVRTAHDVKDIKERLDGISKDMSQFNFMSKRIEENPTRFPNRKETHSFVKVEDVIGRDREKEELIELLLPKEENCQLSLSVISVIGFGGLGKTTLAQFVYNDVRVQRGFDFCLWACVNSFSDLKEALVTILTSVLGSKPHDNSLDQLQRQLRERIEGKKYFLVLDDVWDEDPSNWRELKKILDCGKNGSKILATTRSTVVAECLNAIKPYYQLNILSKERAWDLFAKSTFEEGELSSNDSELVRLGEQIVRKCGYVPLALIIVGSMLRSKEKDKKTWLSVVDNELADVLSDNKDDQIMKVLMISYNGLPPALKHCFAYCSIFPKDYKFDKDELVRMWAAQGFIERHPKKSLEEVGDVYFFHMVDRCFFQGVVWDTSEGYPRHTYKMHDLLHDLAIQVAGMESRCFIREALEGMGGRSSLRHISVKCHPDFLFDPFVLSPHSKTLRSLLLGRVYKPFKTSSLNLLLGSFTMLRALQMSFLDVDVLPDTFGGLIHLRYLDLSENRGLKKIPNSICKLQHLQTLDLRSCGSLVELPSNLRKLGSLRHLFLNECRKLESLPSGLAEITTLVSLDRLIVHPSNGGLRYLGCLDDLCGAMKIELPITGWSDCVEDARKSSMSKKKKLNGMIIDWVVDGEHETTKEETQAVLEALRPHENLQYLSIKGYAGDKLSSWVVSLSNLKELRLYGCTLEYLYPEDVKFESILPCLEILKMESLRNLKGWWREVAIPGDDSPISVSPSLSKVWIIECPNLVEGMPLLRGIEELHLKEVNGKLVGKLLSTRTPNLKVIELWSVKDLSCLPKDSIKCLTSLRSLEIRFCKELRWVSSCELAYLTALEELVISYCENVKWEDKDEEDEKEEINNNSGLGMPWKALQRLRELTVPWQRHLQGGLQYLTALEELSIEYYEKKQVEADNEMVEKGLHLPALQKLYIGFNEMPYSCFPKWIQRLHFLKQLRLINCVELRMSWTMLANMNYLQQLLIWNVKKVVNVDETEAEQQIQFSSLIELYISLIEDESCLNEVPWKALQRLRRLRVPWHRHLQGGLQYLTALEVLEMGYYVKEQVEADNEMVEKGLHLPALQTLHIKFNWMPYSCFPKWIQRLRFLKQLHLYSCVELRMSWTMLANMNLQELFIWEVEKVVNVDETEAEQQIQFSSLVKLYISFIEDGSWILDIPWKLFQSLRTIQLWGVQNLKKIPDGFKHLSSLQELTFEFSSPELKEELKERCKPETGEDWHLISHIPTIKIY